MDAITIQCCSHRLDITNSFRKAKSNQVKYIIDRLKAFGPLQA